MTVAMALIFTLTVAGGFLFPWWWCAFAAFSVGFFLPRAGIAFRDGALGVAVAWMIRAAILDWGNHGLLASRVAEVFHLPHPGLLYVVTACIGAAAGGLGGLAGHAMRDGLRRAGYFRRGFRKA